MVNGVRSCFRAFKWVRLRRAPVGQDRSFAVCEHLELADDPLTPAVCAGTARLPGAFEAEYTQRVLHLDRLGGRVERVGHVALHRGRAVAVRAGAAAAADGLVVGPVGRPQGDTAHRAATGSGDAIRKGFSEGAEDDVDDALA